MYSDFPQPGEVGNVYIDLEEDKLYIWDSASSTYISQSWNQSIITSIQTQITALQNNKLDKGGYVGTAKDLKNNIETKQKKLSSFDESILIEPDGNIEGNVSLFTEYFNQQVCELNFTPIQIIGVYLNGIKQKPSLYTIIPPKTISVANFVTNDYIEIQYTHLKS